MFLKLRLFNFRNFKLEKIVIKKYEKSSAVNSCIGFHSLCLIRGSSTEKLCLVDNKNLNSLAFIRGIHIPPTLLKKIVPFNLSDIGEGIVEVTIKEWFIKPGDEIAQFDNICEVQSDKASVTITSRYDGVVKKLHHKVDEIAKVGQALIDIELNEEIDDNKDDDSSSDSDEEKDGKDDISLNKANVEIDIKDKALATPAVRRIAKENNVDIQNVKATGKSGRVLKEDILAFIQGKKTSEKPKIFSVPQPAETSVETKVQPQPLDISVQPQPIFQYIDRDRHEEITGIRKAMTKSMTTAWAIPHFSYCDEININELVTYKNEIKNLSQLSGVKLTFMPFFIKAASLALLKYPVLNSHVDEKCEKLTIKGSHNIGIAMDTQNGLIVPNVKNVQNLSVIDIGRELNRLQSLGVTNQFSLNDLKDGTFTLSNIGSIGGTYTKPIIFAPQVLIGALGKIQTIPRFDENKNITEAHIFNVSWSADHRVIDGATVARFSNLWKTYLSCPKLLLEL